VATATRLDIDLEFSLSEPTAVLDDRFRMEGTVTAAGLAVEVYSSRPELFLQARRVTLREIRALAADLARRGLTVSLSGPNGLVVRLGAMPAPIVQRILTGSAHVTLGSRAALAPLLRRRSRRRPGPGSATTPVPVLTIPPATPFPLLPTFDRRIRRRVTTTHYERGAGRPRLIFVVGSRNWDGRPPREFELLPGITRIGSGPDADLRLDGLEPLHAEIRHDRFDEYVLVPIGMVAGSARPDPDATRDRGYVLRTGARIELGQWRMAFFREEFADHGRPFGGRAGGELAYQKPQPARRPAAPGA
jgi:hypothetical protein